MKISVLLSMTAVIFACGGKVEADLILPPSLNECLAIASTQPAQDRCYAIEECVKNSSSGEQDLQNCRTAAEKRYLESVGATSGAPSSEGSLTESPIATVPSDSDYSDRDGQKGWENTSQGAL